MQTFKATDTEKAAMEAVSAAIKALPKDTLLQTDEDEGVITFWRRTPNGEGTAIQIGVMRCKRRVEF